MEKKKYYLVSAEALPEVFIKVAEAKRMLQVGEADTVGEAARLVGISRSAFYKYKDAVQPFQNMRAGHIITFYALLKDIPGVLSNYLSIFANSGANILTINQTIPTNGCAGVTISAPTKKAGKKYRKQVGLPETLSPQIAKASFYRWIQWTFLAKMTIDAAVPRVVSYRKLRERRTPDMLKQYQAYAYSFYFYFTFTDEVKAICDAQKRC